MVYNSSYNQLPKLTSNSLSRALLTRLDGKGSYYFLINPESYKRGLKADYSTLKILKGDTLLSYQNTDSTFTIPKFYLGTPNNDRDLTSLVEALESLVYPTAIGLDPPVCSFSFGKLLIPRVVVSKVDLEDKQWRSGALVFAEGSMDLLRSPLPAKALLESEGDTLTDKEKAQGLATLQKPDNLKIIGINPESETILLDPKTLKVSTAATDKTKARVLGTLTELLNKVNKGIK